MYKVGQNDTIMQGESKCLTMYYTRWAEKKENLFEFTYLSIGMGDLVKRIDKVLPESFFTYHIKTKYNHYSSSDLEKNVFS